jgi:hypothetical protein
VRWATRAGVHIDRAACAWVIRRFIDPDAEFTFVTDPAAVPPAATAFDIRGADLSHHGADCSFETILRRYDLEVARIGDVITVDVRAGCPIGRWSMPGGSGCGR